MLKAKKEELQERGYKGFTLMEMLIVVAIIAVLVAIAIPVFTSQLEKSREATDEANIRSIYAALSADVLTDTAVSQKQNYNGAATYQVVKNGATVTGTATYTMKQQTDGTVSGSDIEIAGVSIPSGSFKTGTCTITVTNTGAMPTFTWSA